MTTAPSYSQQFRENGFCRIPDVLPLALLDRLREYAERRFDAADPAHLARYSHHGSLLPVTVEDAPVADVLVSDMLRKTFDDLGFADPRWLSGYVISKPAHSPGLWWHQDWWAWDHPLSHAPQPTQVFCMIYLEPTTRENGCLRAIPGTHRRRHPLHDALPVPHTEHIEGQPPESVSHLPVPDELDIEAQPGDLVLGDVRVIHATHPNSTDRSRTAIDLLFIPDFGALPAEFRSYYVNQICLPPVGWWDDPGHPLVGSELSRILPTYTGPPTEGVRFTRRPRWPADGSG